MEVVVIVTADASGGLGSAAGAMDGGPVVVELSAPKENAGVVVVRVELEVGVEVGMPEGSFSPSLVLSLSQRLGRGAAWKLLLRGGGVAAASRVPPKREEDGAL